MGMDGAGGLAPSDGEPRPRRAGDGADCGAVGLVHLLTVTIVTGLAIAISIPVFFGHQQKSYVGATVESLRSAVSVVQDWRSDHKTYVGLEPSQLTPRAGVTFTMDTDALSRTYYCLAATHRDLPRAEATWHVVAGSPQVVRGSCPAISAAEND